MYFRKKNPKKHGIKAHDPRHHASETHVRYAYGRVRQAVNVTALY